MLNPSSLIGKGNKNPFAQSQARDFNNQTVIDEFQPTSTFWSLFNVQHEILIGTRGSGKTILLRMMRYSLLKKLNHPDAKKLVEEKKFIGIYAPTQIEFMGLYNIQNYDERTRIKYFEFCFNCLLAKSFLEEILSVIDDIENTKIKRTLMSDKVAEKVRGIWFPVEEAEINFIEGLIYKITVMYENTTIAAMEKDEGIPLSFSKAIGSPIQAVAPIVCELLGLSPDTKWILCIDEAEFLKEPYQKCFNTVMRSQSKNIVFKLATLPFKYTTQSTSVPGTHCNPHGNDNNFRVIDMDYEGDDFILVVEKIFKVRIRNVIDENIGDISLDSFLNSSNSCTQIDYFKREFPELSDPIEIEKDMISQFDVERRKSAMQRIGTDANEKTVFQKFAPIYFTRKIFQKSKIGNTTPGWFCGSKMIRQLSNGNPRRFFQLMHALFEGAAKQRLSDKLQHKIVMEKSNSIVESSYGLELYGPELLSMLKSIGEFLHNKTHSGPLIECGNTFLISRKLLNENYLQKAIELGIQFSFISVSKNEIENGVSDSTRYRLANIVSAVNWIPMRAGGEPVWDEIEHGKPRVKNSLKDGDDPNQLVIF